jgi:hypothetical protein
MPSQSISNYITISVALEGSGSQPAGFGTPIFVSDHVITANRLDGPYLNLAAMVTAGFISTTPEYAWASDVFAQQPRVQSVYIGRRDSGDADLAASLDAILAVDGGAWYCINLESRTDADIAALAAWVESASFPKIAIAQSDAASLINGTGPQYNALFEGTVADGTYILTFTGFGLPAPVALTVTRAAGTPATLALIAEDMADALELEADTGGDLEDVVDLASIVYAGVEIDFGILPGLAAGTVVASGTAVASTADITITIPDAAIGETLFRNQYTRTALLYHATDSEYLDGAWASRCLSFDLDVQKGAWSYKRIAGIAGDALNDAQVTALRSVNCNYFAPAVMSSGVQVQAFTAQGWMPSGDAAAGRRIDVTTSLDWYKARLEEATINVNLRDPHDVPFTDAGINRYFAAWTGVNNTGIKAGHLVEFVVPEGEDLEGTKTPYLDVPQLSDTTTTQRQNRTLSATGLSYLRSSIERVTLAIEARQ